MSNVVSLPVVTTLPIPPEKVLQGALQSHEERPFSRVLVIAVYDDDGEEFFAASETDAGSMLWDMERCRHQLMKNADE